MNWLHDKFAAEVSASDLQELLDMRAVEDQWLDYKREAYEPVKRHQMLKDIVALANAAGGYLLIGAEETRGGAIKAFRRIPNARQVADDMLKSCLQNISPRILDLEIAAVTAPDGSEIVVVRVPSSASRPHMFTLGGRTQFVSRYGTHNREMTVEEIRALFLADRSLLSLRELSAKVDDLIGRQTQATITAIQPSDNALSLSSPKELMYLMDKRFQEQFPDLPYYRIRATPAQLDPERVDINDAAVRQLFQQPPQTRTDGWVIWHMREVKVTSEGLLGTTGGGTQRLVLLRNGYVEFSHPGRDEAFQWAQSPEEAASHPLLYSYAVCEFAVNFARLVAAIAENVRFRGEYLFKQDYVHIRGFRLRADRPPDRGFYRTVSQPFAGEHLGGLQLGAAVPFDADQTAFRLVEQVYSAFGYERGYIPLFNADGHFDAGISAAMHDRSF